MRNNATPLFLLILLLTTVRLPAQDSSSSRPNIVFFYVDDLGWRDVGVQGSSFYETPHIDSLARDGIRFTNAYANAPNCAPSRACLMSGQYGPRHGIYTVGSSKRGKPQHRKLVPIENEKDLAPRFKTLGGALSDGGYMTAHMGKWHLGLDPTSQGFQINVGGNRAGHPKSYFPPYRNKNLPDGPEGEYLTDRLTDEAIAFIGKNRKRPFFLYLAHYAVHTPIQAPQSVVDKYRDKTPAGGHKNARYAAMIERTDASLGRILGTLDKLKIASNTIVIFYSDNGGMGKITSMAPLRGAKGMLYEGGIRVPCIIRWPGVVKPSTTCATPVIGTDFYPTLLAATGTKKPKGLNLDGVDITPLLQGKKTQSRALHWHFPAYLQANARKGTWRTTPAAAIRRGRYKLIEYFEDGRKELYDLEADIGEAENVADQKPEIAAALHTEMLAWRKSVGAPIPTEREPRYEPKK